MKLITKDINDLKSNLGISHSRGNKYEEHTHVYRQTDFLTGRGAYAASGFSSKCRPVPRQLQDQGFHLSRSISLHGLCTTDLSGKSQRYRIMSSISKKQTLSYGYLWQCISQHIGQRQQGKGLADLCRFCSLPDSEGTSTVSRRRLRRRTRTNRLRTGCNDHRPMLVSISMGPFSTGQSSGKTTHALGSARQYSNVHSHKRWQAARCQYTGLSYIGTRSFLHNGSRISRLCPTTHDESKQSFFCDPGQMQSQISQTIFPSGRSLNGDYIRSKRHAHRLLFCLSLSGEAPPDQISRCRYGQDSYLSDQQLLHASIDHCTTVSLPVAGRTFFQMDQTEPQNQEFLRNKRQRREDSGMDRSIHICSGGDYKKAAQVDCKSLYNFTNFERDYFRENIIIADTYGYKVYGQ